MSRTQRSSRPSPAATPALDSAVKAHLGQELRSLYDNLVGTDLPRALARLMERLEAAIRARTEAPDPAFLDELLNSVPSLRNFAMSLTRNLDQAEDLVQDTVLRAWNSRDKFAPGTNLQAWLFTILRNAFYSEHRKRQREVEDTDGSYAASQITLPDQIGKLALQDFSAALSKLPPDQRDALVLVGAEGVSYEDAAMILGVAVGTIKSRVNRARTRLAELLGLDAEDALGRAYVAQP